MKVGIKLWSMTFLTKRSIKNQKKGRRKVEVGIKLWSTNPVEYIESAGFADFVEVMPVDLESLVKFSKKEYNYTVHVPHESFGFNPVLDLRKSRTLLERGIAAAKQLKSSRLIMHASHFLEKPDEQAVKKAIAALLSTAKVLAEVAPIVLTELRTMFETKFAATNPTKPITTATITFGI